MLPFDRSEIALSSFINSLVCKLQEWTRQQIVDDDPWDEKTLFPTLLDCDLEQQNSQDASSSLPSTHQISSTANF